MSAAIDLSGQHFGRVTAIQFWKILLALGVATCFGQEPRSHTYIVNSTLPLNAVEIAPDFVLQWDDFFVWPPAERPANIPASCVLVEVYQWRIEIHAGERDALQYEPVWRFIGWVYIEARDNDWLHGVVRL